MGDTSGITLRRATGGLFMAGALLFSAAATLLSSAFDWPDILREPSSVVLPAFVEGATSLVWIWLATARTYAILALPILLLPAVLGRRDDPALRVATLVGAGSVLLSLIGFLRWVFVVPALAQTYVTGDAATKVAVDAAWIAQHQFGGALLGEHLGQLLVMAWSVPLSIIILRSRALPRWLGFAGLTVSALYFLNQGDILATALPGSPVWDLAGVLGSTGWGLWVAALGLMLLLRPIAPRTTPPPEPSASLLQLRRRTRRHSSHLATAELRKLSATRQTETAPPKFQASTHPATRLTPLRHEHVDDVSGSGPDLGSAWRDRHVRARRVRYQLSAGGATGRTLRLTIECTESIPS